MKKPAVPILLLAAFVGFVLAGCQAKDEQVVEGTFRSLLKLSASDAADGDNFGYSVALDGSFALAGAPGVDGAGTDRGAAYLFLKSQGGADGWGVVKTLKAQDEGDGDFFGVSVDISGDYAVIGAGGENGSGTNQGAAYIFYRNQGGADNWGQVKKIVASDKADDDGFGYSVSIDGETVIVGAEGEDGTGTDRGAAYVFSKDQGGTDNWGQIAKIVSGDPNDVDQFGHSVTLKGDLVLVGSPGEDGAGTDRGAAYLFSRDLGGTDAWGLVKRIVPSDETDNSWFGNSVAIDGALALIGSGWQDGGGNNRGAAYIFSQSQGGADNWGQIKKLTASDAHDSDMFGYSVSLDGTSALVCAGWAKGGGTERGQAYLYLKDEGGTDNWGEAQRLRASDGANEDWFGFSSVLLGSYILVGAVGEDGSGSQRGAAYLFKHI
jgi:hypothetical protein